MVKEIDKVETKAPEAPSCEADVIKGVDERASGALAAVQVALSLNTSGFSDEDGALLKKASVSRYREFAPEDATESVLVILALGLQNATMKSLEYAAGADSLEARTVELRNATRGATTTAELLEALGRHRGRSKQSVMVGQVTVETGAQAIVGNVNTEGRRSTKPQETESPNDDSSRAKK